MENLNLLNTVRMVAQNIKNEGFKREYKKIIEPILEKYRNHIVADWEMYTHVRKAIVDINRLSVTYQYIPNHVGCNRQKISFRPDFSDHSLLYELEKLTESIINGKYYRK